MLYKRMEVSDIEKVIPMYIEYYNKTDGSSWTHDTVYKRIHQVLTREDAYCLTACSGDETVGFIMGYCEQYDDIIAYDLTEIVVTLSSQSKGIGTGLMRELERRVKALGVSMIQLQAENDAMHDHFYRNKLQYEKTVNFVLMAKWL